MTYSPRFKMPEKTIGEEWHEQALEENPIFSFLTFGSCFFLICLIITIVGGSQNEALGYYGKEEILIVESDLPMVAESSENEEVPEIDNETSETQLTSEIFEEDISIQSSEVFIDDYDENGYVYCEPIYYSQEYQVYDENTDQTYDVQESYADWMVAGGDTSLKDAGSQYSEDGTKFTWYSENILPGGGLDIPGRHVGDDGFIMDDSGNICVASSDHERGAVIETPYGTAKVYDTGCANGVIDMYTSW